MKPGGSSRNRVDKSVSTDISIFKLNVEITESVGHRLTGELAVLINSISSDII